MPIKKTLLLVCCAALLACSKPDYTTATGDSGHFNDLRGKWLLINYWADWCKPCIEEIPELNQFSEQYTDKAILFTVNYDGVQGKELQDQINKLHLRVPVLIEDPASKLSYTRPQALPTTLVFGPDGQLKKTLVGPQTIASLKAAISNVDEPGK